MITIYHANIYKIHDYSVHLKELPDSDKYSRFGYVINDHSIDQMILNMCYHPKDHELWYARTDDRRVGWEHMARNPDGSWEVAVSVEQDFQRQGIGSRLIGDMIAFAKFHSIPEIYMHCIEENRVIQHLANKHELKTRERGGGERTSAITVPAPNVFEANTQLWKEHNEIMAEHGKLRTRLTELWAGSVLPKQLL